jgi:hypothetical protein
MRGLADLKRCCCDQLVQTVSGWLYVPTGNLFKREQVQCGTRGLGIPADAACARRRDDRVRRREFITLLGGAAAWPLAAQAQGERMRRIGVLTPLPADDAEGHAWMTAFTQAL